LVIQSNNYNYHYQKNEKEPVHSLKSKQA